jgi:hypothetical protein
MKKERENFVGDWKNPPHRNYKQTKGKTLFSFLCCEAK